MDYVPIYLPLYLPINLSRHSARPMSPAELARMEQAYYQDNAGFEWRMPGPIRWAFAEVLPVLAAAIRQGGYGVPRGRTPEHVPVAR